VPDFWRDKPLSELSETEWESLCDGCGRCCLVKLEDMDSGELHFTNIACRHLRLPDCRCNCYAIRTSQVPDCLQLTPDSLPDLLDHLPTSCAYRRLYEGRALPAWHPLISGEKESVVRAGISVRDRVVSEEYIHPEQFPDHIIHWHEWQGEE
jgi:uncharacterized cysteine cluster protein YcgN (CxxCxxCC family)